MIVVLLMIWGPRSRSLLRLIWITPDDEAPRSVFGALHFNAAFITVPRHSTADTGVLLHDIQLCNAYCFLCVLSQYPFLLSV